MLDATGRAESANQTLQDRLIKEMRLENITGIEEANVWLETFIQDFNRRFAKVLQYPKNLHRTVDESQSELDDPNEENTHVANEKIMILD